MIKSNTPGETAPTQFAEEAEALLAHTRPPKAIPVPDAFLDERPLLQGNSYGRHAYDEFIYRQSSNSDCFRGKIILFDLDDTLLTTNYICGETWNTPCPGKSLPECQLSIRYKRMRHSLGFWLKGRWNRPIREQYDSSRYSFLKNPDVEGQLRPGALALLLGIREAGGTPVLITLCARRRLSFLFSRIPAFEECFICEKSGRLNVICAEDLAMTTLFLKSGGMPEIPESLPPEMLPVWEHAKFLHESHADRFSLKTLITLYLQLGICRLDALIDDSVSVEKDYNESPAASLFLKAEALRPFDAVVKTMLDDLVFKLEGTKLSAAQDEDTLHDYPFLRFEDPLYFPFVHTFDRLKP